MELHNRTLGQWLEHWAETTPDKEYIVYSDRDLRFTWSEFNKRVDDMAKGMLAIGITHGTHVGVWATNVPDWLTFLYAGAKIGAVLVTINTNYKQSELEYLVENADIHTMCITDGVFDGSYVDMVYTMLPELKTSQRGYLKSKRFPRLRNVVYIGQEKYRGMYNTPEMLLLGQNIKDETLEAAKARVNCHDVVNMQYTSGTTGFPKGVMLTHYNIANNGFLTGEHMKFTADDKLCCCVPLFHCFGVVLASMNVLTHGCTQVMVEKFDPLLVLASIHKERCTAVYGVPTMFIAELNHPMFEMFDLTSLRTGIMAGSLCPVELMKTVDEKMHMRVTSVYGLTETSPGMTHSRIEDPAEVRYNTVGHEFEFTEVRVIDPETGEECPVGVQGEMCNRGYNNMKGYYKNEAATNEAIDKDGFLHSGDLGVKDENGNYRITGRIKDMIIRGGENIYPRELEEFLYHFPGVKDVQVAAVPSKKYGEEVGAFIILHDGVTATEEEVKDFCRGKIARHKIPKYIFFVDTFPMTGSGKIQKFKLKDLGLKLLQGDQVSLYKLPSNRPDIVSLFESMTPYFNSKIQPTDELLQLKMVEGVYVLLNTDKNLYASIFDFTDPWKIDILEFMERNYMNDISMEEIANYTGRSLSTFKRDFKKCSALSPREWLIRRRLEAAHGLIRKGGRKVSEICFEVGFKNLSHFSKIYKIAYGVPPTEDI